MLEQLIQAEKDLRIETNEVINHRECLMKEIESVIVDYISSIEPIDVVENKFRTFFDTLKVEYASRDLLPIYLSIKYGSYCFNIKMYSKEIYFEILMDEIKIGAMYYWMDCRTHKRNFFPYFSEISFNKYNYNGFEKDVPSFLNGLKIMIENLSDILNKMEETCYNKICDEIQKTENELRERQNKIDFLTTEIKKEKQSISNLFDM